MVRNPYIFLLYNRTYHPSTTACLLASTPPPWYTLYTTALFLLLNQLHLRETFWRFSLAVLRSRAIPTHTDRHGYTLSGSVCRPSLAKRSRSIPPINSPQLHLVDSLSRAKYRFHFWNPSPFFLTTTRLFISFPPHWKHATVFFPPLQPNLSPLATACLHIRIPHHIDILLYTTVLLLLLLVLFSADDAGGRGRGSGDVSALAALRCADRHRLLPDTARLPNVREGGAKLFQTPVIKKVSRFFWGGASVG